MLKPLKPKVGLYGKCKINRGGGTGEASEALASPEFRCFTTEISLAYWIYERGNFLCFTGKKLVPTPLIKYALDLNTKVVKLKL